MNGSPGVAPQMTDTTTAPQDSVDGNSFISSFTGAFTKTTSKIFDIAPRWVADKLGMEGNPVSPMYGRQGQLNTAGGPYAIGGSAVYVDAPTSGNNFNGHGSLAAALKAGDYPTYDPEWQTIAMQYKNGLTLTPKGSVGGVDIATLAMMGLGAIVVVMLLKKA